MMKIRTPVEGSESQTPGTFIVTNPTAPQNEIPFLRMLPEIKLCDGRLILGLGCPSILENGPNSEIVL